MTTRKRRTISTGHRSTSRSSTSRSTTSRRPVTRRRRTSVSSTFGTAVGAALAGVLAAVLGGLSWWAWVLLIVVGLGVGLVWAARRGRAMAADDAIAPPAADPVPGPS